MKVLIVGGGRHEHAITWKTSQSPKAEKFYYAPDNADITKVVECVDIGVIDLEKLVAFAGKQAIDLVVVGPDDPLAAGAVDTFEDAGIRAFGPRKNAAILEVSEALSKDLIEKYNIPSAVYETFDSPEEALAYLGTILISIVLKMDGLALGKGVPICDTRGEVKEGVKTLTLDKQLGSVGNRIVIEEFTTGREVSVFSFADGYTIKTMTSVQDHKRTEDGDQGLNTGGMGTFSPSPFYMDGVGAFYRKCVYQPAVDAMKTEGKGSKGIIFFGPMLTENDPRVLGYNARFGDPETQVVLPRMRNDIVDVFEVCVDGTLDQIELELENNATVCIVLASNGYPEHYKKGYKIDGLDRLDSQDGHYVFHAGNKLGKDGNVVTSGGGVLGVTAKDDTLKGTKENAYRTMEWVEFGNKYMRHDVGEAIDEA